MKNFSKLLFVTIFVFGLTVAAVAQQQQVEIPRASQRAEVWQTVGDAKVGIIYHRPSVKGREIWGKLVPYGQVWRVGANENTIFEVTQNAKINGQDLPAGRYGLHAIPNKDEWILIFNKVNNEWGSFRYDEKQDALRVKIKPQWSNDSRETMLISFDSVTPTTTEVVVSWEKLRLPFTVDVGDVNSRVLGKLRTQIASADSTNTNVLAGARITAANFVIDNKIKDSYAEAAKWIDEALKMRETFQTLRAKARISAEMGNFKEAVMYGEKAVTIGKAANPPINAELLANFEKEVAAWKAK